MKRMGKMHYEPVTIPAVMMFKVRDEDPDVVMLPERTLYRLTTEDGTPWNDACLKVKRKENTWFIAVTESGWISMAEQDPTMISVPDNEIIAIEHPGGHDDIISHRWTGKEVVPWQP